MKSAVELQDMFSYSKTPVIILVIALGVYVLWFIFLIYLKYFRKPKPKKEPIVVYKVADKGRYLRELDRIKVRYDRSELSMREAYQLMSLCIRKFVFESTGKKVQNFTLMDLRIRGMNDLGDLIEEYYRPEFERFSEGDFMVSYEKTKRAIENWN